MPASFRVLFKFVVGFFAALQGAAVSTGAQESRAATVPRSQTLTMATFIARLRHDAALRTRFADNPASILRENGIDPTPFRLSGRLDPAQLERLLAGWDAGGGLQFRVAQLGAQPSPPAVVYGPPPGPPRGQSAPPAPVYGPPPGLSDPPVPPPAPPKALPPTTVVPPAAGTPEPLPPVTVGPTQRP